MREATSEQKVRHVDRVAAKGAGEEPPQAAMVQAVQQER
jgi:hypothetical protein